MKPCQKAKLLLRENHCRSLMNTIIIKTLKKLNVKNLSILFFLTLAAVLIIQRTVFAFEYPIPWNDEVAFIAQAFALSTENTLFVWGLNQEQIVMWMPPGYMIMLAAFYKVFGYSFELTRWISSALYFMSILTILHIIKYETKSNIILYSIALLLMLTTFLSPYSLTIANIARMESFYFLLFTLSLLFFTKNLSGVALAIVIASATIHYNAIYFLFPASVFILWCITTNKSITIRSFELLSLCVSALVILTYLLFVANNLNSFIQDMQFQFEWKKIGEVMSGRKGWITLAALSLIPICILFISKTFNTSMWLSLYGISFIAMALNGHNMWYSFAFQTGYMLLAISVIILLNQYKQKKIQTILIFICIPLIAQQLNYAWGKHDQFSPMLSLIKSPSQSFLNKEDINKTRKALHALPSGSSISFGYTGVEPFFFNTMYQAGLKWGIPGNSVTQLHPVRSMDYRVHCDSSLFPKYLFMYDWDGYPRKGEDTGCALIDLSVKKQNAK